MRLRARVGVVLSILISTGAAADRPMPISPGSPEGVAVVAGRCPTFSWTAVEAESVNLIVYRLPLADSGSTPERVLAVTLPGAADSWTPALDQCLEPAARYAWSVGTAGVWSEASLFEVSTAPSVVEVEQALAVLRRFVGEPEAAPPAAELEVATTGQERPTEALWRETTGGQERAWASSEVPRAAPSTTPSLVVDDEIHLGSDSDIFREGASFLWTDGTGSSTTGSLAVGLGALQAMTGTNNTAVGHTALFANTTGTNNSAFGEDALGYNEMGSFNSAFGEDALRLNTTGSRNSAFGEDALFSNTTGNVNSAFGEDALTANTTGTFNSAFGQDALEANTAGSSNSAFGENAMYRNTAGGSNSAFGKDALLSNTTGSRNSALGTDALLENTTGSANTAVGEGALLHSIDGSRNVAIGEYAGLGLYNGSDNIFILNFGERYDNGTIRIGRGGIQDQTFIAGVNGGVLAEPNLPVMVDDTGKLGTTSSSRRYKQDISDLGAGSERLLNLRAVTFRYRPEAIVGDSPMTFGLIAEEVAEVFPELVVNDDQGRPAAVKYHLLSSLLLNELQKQHRQLWVQWFLIAGVLLTSLALSVGRMRFGW